jgi:hypothetical protein
VQLDEKEDFQATRRILRLQKTETLPDGFLFQRVQINVTSVLRGKSPARQKYSR